MLLAVNLCAQIDRHDGVASLGYDDLRWRWDSAWAARIRFVFARLDGSWLISGGYQASTFVCAAAGLASLVHSSSLKRGLFLL